MWINRLVMITLLALMLAAMYATGRMLGLDARAMLTGLAFGMFAGAIPAVVVLFVARGSEHTAPETTVAPYAPESEDDAPYMTWPDQFMTYGIDGESEESFPEMEWGQTQ